MQIKNIKLTNFKSYRNQQFAFNARYNAIVGFNGMGKTNLLDAIYFSCMTKSNFTAQDKNLVLSGQNFFRTQAAFDDSKVVCKYEKSKKKIFEVNNKAYVKLADHIGKYPVVFIVPDDQRLLLEGSIERRKLMDNTISQLDKAYLYNLIKYNNLLNQRNAYLKLSAKTGTFSEDMATTYTKQMEESCTYIYEKRTQFIANFQDTFCEKYKVISGGEERAECSYKSQLLTGSYLDLSTDNLKRDRILCRTSIGIHKDDLLFTMNDHPVKVFASQGQTKSFILSIKLAQYEILTKATQIKPILLLDDLFDKLDHNRVRHLLKLLEAEKVDQVFISDTDTERVVSILESMKVDYKKIIIKKSNYASEEE